MAATTAVAATAGWPVDGMDPIDGRGAPPPPGKNYNCALRERKTKARKHCTASHRTAPHRIASHRIAPHRIESHRIESHRIALNRIASH